MKRMLALSREGALSRRMRGILLAGAVSGAVPTLHGEDLTLAGGRTLHEVTYSDANPASVRVTSKEGDERVDLVDVPPGVQRRFGFDPIAAIRFLAAENRRLRGELAAPRPGPAAVVSASPAAEAAWASRPPTPPPTALPPLQSGSRVDVFDLVHHYRSDAAGAASRYRGRSFEIEGIVERVESTLVGRGVKVLLESPDRGIRVVVEWRVPDEFPKFYTKAEGRRLFGGAGNAHRLVLSAGDHVAFAVRGGAYEDAAVFLGRAELLRRTAAPSSP